MSRMLLVLGLTLVATGRIWAGEPVATDKPLARAAEVRLAIDRGIGYLTKEGVTWKQKQQCAACHHVPYMAWALHEARDHGYRIDDKELDDVLTWALAERNHAQVFPDLPLDKKHSETDYLGPLLMALGVGADEHRSPAHESARQRLLAHALAQQAPDGSGTPTALVAGRPSIQPGTCRRVFCFSPCRIRLSPMLKTRGRRSARHASIGSRTTRRPTAIRAASCDCS